MEFMEMKDSEIKHLIALRTNYFSMVMLISGGIAGLFFASNIWIGNIMALTFLGAYFDYIFIGKFININNEIKKILKGEK